MKNYGSIISQLRKSKGLTQEQLGKKLNVTYQAVSKWENGLSEPDLETIEKLCEIFNISISEFFSGDMAQNIKKSKPNNQFSFNKLINNPIYLAMGLGVVIFVLSLFVFLIPIKYTNKQIFNRYDASVFFLSAESETKTKTGTGFFINSSGLAVTTFSNIADCQSGKIKLNNGKQYNIVKLVGYDDDNDIAVIQTNAKNTKSVKFGNSNNIKMGDKVFAITYTYTDATNAKSVLSEGVIFKVELTKDGTAVIQTSACADNSNTGGVIFNEFGRVIGLVTGQLNISGVSFEMVNICQPTNKVLKINQDINVSLEEFQNMHKTLTFYSDGSPVGNKPYISGQKITAINNLSKTGYSFGGWFKSEDFSQELDFTKPMLEETVCYAKWIPHTYTIKFNSNGATGTMNDISVNYDELITLPTNSFEWQKCKFIGWEQQGTENIFNQNEKIKNLTTENNDVVILNAVWQKYKYSIIFDGNSAELGTMNNLVLECDQVSNLPNNEFSKTGYLFNGWHYNGTLYENEQQVVGLCETDESITFIAQWEPITYYIKFVSNSGEGESTTQTFIYDEPQKLEACQFDCSSESKVFYWWNCYYTDEKGNSLLFNFSDEQEVVNLTTINGQVFEFVASWGEFYYLVSFDYNSGEGQHEPVRVYRNRDTMLSNYFSETPFKEGYNFMGWEYNGTTYSHGSYFQVDFGVDKKPVPITFSAQWSPKNYTVRFYFDLDTYLNDWRNFAYTQILTYDKPEKLKKNEIVNPYKEIDYWLRVVKVVNSVVQSVRIDNEAEVVNLVSDTGYVTLCAVWKDVVIPFKIAYHNLDAKGGLVVVDEVYNVSKGSTFVRCNTTLFGYEFEGFVYNEVLYEAGKYIRFKDDLQIQEGEIYHIYAQWRVAETCEIVFYANGGEGEMQTVFVYKNQDYFLPNCLFVKEGYEFLFWSVNKECVLDGDYQDFNRYNVGEEFSLYNYIKQNSKITLWANWKKIVE